MSMTTLDAAKCALDWVSVRWSKDQDSLKNVFDPVLHDAIFRNRLCGLGYGMRSGSGVDPGWVLSSLRGTPMRELEKRQWSPASDKPWPIERVKITRVAIKVLSATNVELKIKYSFVGPFDLETYGMVEVSKEGVGRKPAKEADAPEIRKMVRSKEIWTEVSEKVKITLHPTSKKIASLSCYGDVEKIYRKDNDAKFEDNTATFAAMVEHWKKDPSTPINCKFSIGNTECCDAMLRWNLPLNKDQYNTEDAFIRNERQHRLKIVDNKITEVTEQNDCREIERRNKWENPLGEGSSSEDE